MALDLWIGFAVLNFWLALAPGPAVLFVVSRGLSAGPVRSLAAAAGIVSANAVYFALSATSLGAILAASETVFRVIQWAGAAYLVWIGAQSIMDTSGGLRVKAEGGGESAGRIYVGALLLQFSNPKCIVYFAAILPPFIDRSLPVGPQMLILGATSVVSEFAVLAGYCAAAGSLQSRASSPRFARAVNVASGVLLIAAAAGVLMAR